MHLQPKRPRRCVLSVPGSSEKMMAKASATEVDQILLDLEDAVAPDAKESARNQVCKAVNTGGYGMRELVIRVNGLATAWGYADIAAAATSGAHAILLPKVESADAIRQLETIMVANGARIDGFELGSDRSAAARKSGAATDMCGKSART